MTTINYDLSDKRVQYLIESDLKLGKLIKHIGNVEPTIEKDGFKCLVKYIVGQQISDKARDTIWKRICMNINDITPENILEINDKEFINIGLSARKIDCIQNLSTNILEKRISFMNLHEFSNEEIISKLSDLKGIGKWTVQMYLIFSLCREDIFPESDGTIKRVIKWMYNLNEVSNLNKFNISFNSWKKYSTLASLYFWKANEMGLLNTSFEESVLKKEV